MCMYNYSVISQNSISEAHHITPVTSKEVIDAHCLIGTINAVLIKFEGWFIERY